MMGNLLIVGAGIYGAVAKEIAESMGSFEKIAFVDDGNEMAPDGSRVIGSCADIERLTTEYNSIIVAIGNPKVRLSLLQKNEAMPCKIATLVSPYAYVAPSAQIMQGCIVEPMSVVHTGAVISRGCIISAGAVVNHASVCCEGVHVDCNATVLGNVTVPAGTKIKSGTVWGEKSTEPHTPIPVDGKDYNFDDVM